MRRNQLDQAGVIVLDVADARADRPADHLIGRVGGSSAGSSPSLPADLGREDHRASGCEARRTFWRRVLGRNTENELERRTKDGRGHTSKIGPTGRSTKWDAGRSTR